MMTIRTVDQIEVKGKPVFIQVDLNVPLNEKNEITDDTRIVQSLTTIRSVTETDALSHFVDVFGLRQKGTIPSIVPGLSSRAMFEIFKKHNINVISMVSPSFMVEGKRVAAIRIGTEEYEPIVKDLEKAAYAVLSVGKWPSV